MNKRMSGPDIIKIAATVFVIFIHHRVQGSQEFWHKYSLMMWGWVLLAVVVLAFVFFVKPVLSFCTNGISACWAFVKWIGIGVWYLIAWPYYLVRAIVRKFRGEGKW